MMNQLNRKKTEADELECLACELLLGAPYCAQFLETEWLYGAAESESYQERRMEKAELKAALRWLSSPAFLGAMSEQDVATFRRLILTHHIGAKIEQRLESKLGSWGDKLLRSLISSFGGR